MVPLQKLLGKEDKILGLLDSSAGEARRSVEVLAAFLRDPAGRRTLEDFAQVRRASKATYGAISETLCTSFVSSMEGQDIEELANALYRIPKTVEKIGERIMLAPQHLQGMALSEQASGLQRAADALLTMMQELRKAPSLKRLKEQNEQLQSIEGEADKAVLDYLREVYSGHQDAGKVVFLKDLFELLEKVTDRFRDAGNVLVRVALKNT